MDDWDPELVRFWTVALAMLFGFWLIWIFAA